ncbi:MAG: exopolysaccharide biosynthesis protein [Rhizobiaceae bacterium]
MSADDHGFDVSPERTRPPRRRPARRLSDLFAQLARDAGDHVSIAEISDALGKRSFAPLLVLFAAFNLLPLPPGASAVLGLPLVIIAGQMVLGSRTAWLPSVISRRSLSADQFRTVMDWVLPRLVRLEQVIRPRYWPFWRRQGDRIIGALALVLAIIVTLPIPLGNWLPAFSTALLGLALSERDGILLAIGGAVAVASMAVVAAVIGAAGFAGQAALGMLF